MRSGERYVGEIKRSWKTEMSVDVIIFNYIHI